MLKLHRQVLAYSRSLIALAMLALALSLLSDKFLTPENAWNILRQISVNLCLSIGMTLIILAGGIDLSVGAVLALSGAVAAGLLKNGVVLSPLAVQLQFTVFGAIIAGLLVGATAGWFNGFVITRFRLPPFVATLGMFRTARGRTSSERCRCNHRHPPRNADGISILSRSRSADGFGEVKSLK